ncbi:unnamed protein product [Nippostrongylus brasiliensis]|uniref:MFS domain-containing protein n=1 Tax=Nippostrongylus brasiliensis TaxID=27835 RepID=A0A3P7D0F0_NIPBR|nr:unnamed protein product [Nippostrongylus brasiliensis]
MIRNGRGPFRLVQTERSDPITFLFICITAACFNWATNVNMVLSVVVPYQRNAATACQVAISHLFGDSFGPYLLGLVSDAIRGGDESPAANFHSLEISFYIPDAFLFISSLLFFAAAFTFIRDRRRFQERMVIFQKTRNYLSVTILFFLNILNYADRYTIAGVLSNIQDYYDINDAEAGLLQTVFTVFFMISSPLCGFLGDRYNRKWIMVVGITIWVFAVFISSFVEAQIFWMFLLLRGIVGIGEASYVVTLPSIIADMFTSVQRSRMLMCFYFAIPCMICLTAIIICVEEPERGAAEREQGEITANVTSSGYLEDLLALLKNRTYVFSTAGYTAIVFVIGTIAWWTPSGVEHKFAENLELNNTESELSPEIKARINITFGAMTCIGGMAGVFIGSILAHLLRSGRGPFRSLKTVRSNAIVCGVGAVIGFPSLLFALHTEVVIPSRRSVATSWQILMSHLFGDASAPYIVGKISDTIRGDDDTPGGHFRSLVSSFYMANVLLVVSALFFFLAAYTFVGDRMKFQKEMGVPRDQTLSEELNERYRSHPLEIDTARMQEAMLLLALIGASSLVYVQSSNATAVAAPVSTLYETVNYIFDEAKLLSYEDVKEMNTKQYEEIEKLVAELNKTSPHHHESSISSNFHGKIAGSHPQKHHNATEAEHQQRNATGHGHHLPPSDFHVELPPNLHHRSSDPTKGTHTSSNHTQSINGTINEEHNG